MTTLSRGNPKFLTKPSCSDGVRARKRSGAGLERKRKKVLCDGRDLMGRLLLDCPVLWSCQVFLVSGLFFGRCCGYGCRMDLLGRGAHAAGADDQILDSFGDQTWTDMSEEWRRSELVRQPGGKEEKRKRR